MKRAPALLLVVLACAGCGQKGPPLPPLRPVPQAPAALTVVRRGDRVEVRFTVPAINADGTRPVALERVNVYAATGAPDAPPPASAQLTVPKRLVGFVKVQPAPSEEAGGGTGKAPTGAAATAPKPGEPATFVETLTAADLVPAITAPPSRGRAAATAPKPAASATPAPPRVAHRYYAAVGAANTHRFGPATPVIALPLTPPPPAPKGAEATYDETSLTLTWTAAPGVSYRVYGVGADQHETLLTTAPLTAPSFSEPVAFGARRCLAVRAVEVAGAAAIESEAAGPVCTTPVDTFPPPAPTELRAVAGEHGVNLTWSPVSAPDLAGYIVLRGEGQGGTLQPLMQQPVAATNWQDTTAAPGVRYVYYVIAQDKAGNASPRSNAAVVGGVPLAARAPHAPARVR